MGVNGKYETRGRCESSVLKGKTTLVYIVHIVYVVHKICIVLAI